MSYLDFLRAKLPQDWVITEELNSNWQQQNHQTTAILKAQTGTQYNGSKMQPIQLIVLSDDPLAVKEILDNFIAENNNKFMIDGFSTYIKQYYYSPIVPTVDSPQGNKLVSQVIMTGTLLISENVSDIKELQINGENVEITEGSIGYTTESISQPVIFDDTNNLTKAHVKKATITFTFSCVNKYNFFTIFLRKCRLGQEDINKILNIAVKFTDNDTIENYNVKITSYSITNNQQSLPILNFTLAVA